MHKIITTVYCSDKFFVTNYHKTEIQMMYNPKIKMTTIGYIMEMLGNVIEMLK